MSGFRNSIARGVELVRNALRSPNFAAGVDGWSIERDGSAEFNDVTVRGDIVAGTLATAEAAPRLVIGPGSFDGEIDFETGMATETFPGLVYCTGMTSSPDRAELLVQSPTFGGSGPAANINLRSGASDGSIGPEIILGADTKCFGALKGTAGVGEGAVLEGRTGHTFSFEWDGVNVKVYVDNIHVRTL